VNTTARQVSARNGGYTGDDEHVEVLIIGGRWAGAPLATHLARAGVSVCVADRARFPSDTLSTHVFQGGGIVSLRDLAIDHSALGQSEAHADEMEVELRDDSGHFIAEELPEIVAARARELFANSNRPHRRAQDRVVAANNNAV
jgi:choline dehydrogenase-like flavoprotein